MTHVTHLQRFFDCIEREKGVTAVHCLAGLGRTGTLIGLWIMKHHDFTPQEVSRLKAFFFNLTHRRLVGGLAGRMG